MQYHSIQKWDFTKQDGIHSEWEIVSQDLKME